MKSLGFSLDVFDLNIEIFNSATKEIKEKWDTQDFEFWASGRGADKFKNKLEDLADKIISFDASFIGFSTTAFASAPFMNAILPIIKSKINDRAIIIVGGAGTNYQEARSLLRKDLIDYFIIGEGEFPLLCLLKDLQDSKTVQTDSNYIIWKDKTQDNAVCLKASRDNTINIDDIPFPTFEEFDLNCYTQKDLLPLIGSRGCVRSCVFCCDAPLKKPYRCRSPEKVVEEIEHHVKMYNRKRFEFSDLLINGDLKFLDKFCDLLIDMDLDICWGGQAAVRRDMDINLFRKMKKAGCGGLTFGCESFSNNVLKLMHKGMTSEAAKETFIKAKEAGMLVEINLIVGFPGEEEEDIDETIKFIKENAKQIDKINSLNICTICPGMYIYEHLEKYNIDKSTLTDLYAWYNKNLSNTIEKRVERHKKLMSVCSELNLKPLWQNVKR
ncbi:MAG: B12-binding domain-containing radical SAM protein [Candidatus Omnitrophica bacterium]|nr:B12-binding domain-containing radical SAM protein [Candidatus Omnitrophota bacterium]